MDGFIASIFATVCTHPIDVLKTQYQITKLPISSLHNHITASGYKGYYNGLHANIMTYPIFWGVYFAFRDVKYNTGSPYVDSVVGSLFASTIASGFANPLFVLKVRRQTETLRHNHYTYLQMINHIYKHEGMRGYMKGYGATLMTNTKLIIQFPLYDYIKHKTDNIVASSIASKTITSMIFYPFDTIRTVQRDNPHNITTLNILKTLVREKRLYRGCGLYILSTTPNFVLMMLFKDLISKYMN